MLVVFVANFVCLVFDLRLFANYERAAADYEYGNNILYALAIKFKKKRNKKKHYTETCSLFYIKQNLNQFMEMSQRILQVLNV